MNDKDKEAFEKWWDEFRLRGQSTFGIVAITWKAACEYKQKEIDNQKNLIDECEDRLKKSLHFLYEFEKLQVENAKIRECVEFYAATGSWDAFEASDTSIISGVIADSDMYSPWEEQGISVGGKRARQVLKELEDK